MKTARQVALDALDKIHGKSGYSNLVVDHMLSRSELDARDSAFSSALIYGVIERMITLDAIISRYSKILPEKMDLPVLEILRLGAYQILFMAQVPDNAAVNESVELTRYARKAKTAGFVNAVLRNIIRNRNTVCDFSKVQPIEKRLSLEYSCPQWLVEKWLREYNTELVIGFLERSLGKPPLFVRVNRLRTDSEQLIAQLEREGVAAQEVPEQPDCLLLQQAAGIEKLSSFTQGMFHVQDTASQLCVAMAGIRPGDTVIDVCSAPGGKAFTAAQYLQDQGNLYAFDLYENRVRLIQDGAKRLGITCIKAQVGDALVYRPELPKADVVLCDVVCSGLGVIRRKPEIKYKNPEEIAALPELQLRILKNASAYVKNGGTIIYSTCTLNPDENERVVEAFLAQSSDFAVDSLGEELQVYRNDAHSGCITLFGDVNNSDGFFICRMKRR